MAQDNEKLSIEQFARKLKDANPQLENVPDEDLVRKVFERRPELMDRVQRVDYGSNPNKPPKGPEEGNIRKGFNWLFGQGDKYKNTPTLLQDLQNKMKDTAQERQTEEDTLSAKGKGSPLRAAARSLAPNMMSDLIGLGRQMATPKNLAIGAGMAIPATRGPVSAYTAATSAPEAAKVPLALVGQGSLWGEKKTPEEIQNALLGQSGVAAGAAGAISGAPTTGKQISDLVAKTPVVRNYTKTFQEKGFNEIAKIGEIHKGDYSLKDLNAAREKTTKVEGQLEQKIATVESHMQGQNIDAKAVLPIVKSTLKQISDIEAIPGDRKVDVIAAKDSVAQLADRLQANNGNLSWSEARGYFKQLNRAIYELSASRGPKSPRPPSRLLDNLGNVTKTLETQLTQSAGKQGVGKLFNGWAKGYKSMSNYQRGVATALSRGSLAQREASARASSPVRIGGTNLGRTPTSKVAKASNKLLDKANAGLKHLTRQVESIPGPAYRPSQASPTLPSGPPLPKQLPQGPPPPKQLPGPSQIQLGPSSLGQPTPGSGTYIRNPRMNPVEHPMPNPAPVNPVAPSTPIASPTEPQWPANYANAPKTMSSQGGAGANYSADDLAAFKKKHGIE